MRDATERWSPRSSVCSRPRSVRELYHPAVQDLSDQAARHGQANQEESILSVVNTYTPRSSRPGTGGGYSDKYSCPTPLYTHFNPEEMTKIPGTAPLNFNTHNTEYLEDLHRQRVLVSAHHRRQLKHAKRAKSTPAPSRRNTSCFDARCQNGGDHMNSIPRETLDDQNEQLDLVVRNGMKMDESQFKERIHYRLMSRTKPKTAHPGLMANGAPLPVLNGYHQTLIQNIPSYSQKYCNWLTHGLKVQSFRGRHAESYSHARPPPPLVQYVNRPKSLTERQVVKKPNIQVDFNVIGVQKGVKKLQSDNQNCMACQNGTTNGVMANVPVVTQHN